MHPRHSESGGNMFMVIGLAVLGIAVLLSIGVFAYGHYLGGQEQEKANELKAAEDSVSQSTVEGFIRLRDRFTSAETVLSQHVVLSQFFDSLETLTLQGVRFDSLGIKVNLDRTATLEMSGVAKNFNALAAQSAAFAQEPRIKQAIFSDIKADERGVVSFTLNATLDPKIVELPQNIPSTWTAAAGTATVEETAPAQDESAGVTASTTP